MDQSEVSAFLEGDQAKICHFNQIWCHVANQIHIAIIDS